METRVLKQPEIQLGAILENFLSQDEIKKVVLVSAFVSLRTILRMREKLAGLKAIGAKVVFNLGIDLFGTSKNVLEEIVQWNCDTFITHNAVKYVTFHPKVYILETAAKAIVIVGSNNLTEGGMYTNSELALLQEYDLRTERELYDSNVASIGDFAQPTESGTTKRLSHELIKALVDAKLVVDETEARRKSEKIVENISVSEAITRNNPFEAKIVKFPPLPSIQKRKEEKTRKKRVPQINGKTIRPIPPGVLVWKKQLSASDALQVSGNTNPVGGVRLTQAGFLVGGSPIDQTQYFRQLFDDYEWEKRGKHEDQEHTFVPIRTKVGKKDYGIVNFEISHKPSGEAGQGNYTTQLHWGTIFSRVIREQNLTGKTLRLYETPGAEVDFLLEIK